MEEPNALIRWVIYLFGGGDAALIAIGGLSAIATLMIVRPQSRYSRPQLCVAAVFILVALLVCSSPPFPAWFLVASVVGLIGSGASVIRTRSSKNAATRSRKQIWLVGLLPAIWLACAIGLQVPYLIWSPLTKPISEILIIGDSITAGLNDGDDTWPRQLARTANARIMDASQPGATLKSAQTQNSLLGDLPGLLVLEIGGNDLLEGLPVAQFEQDLDRLLNAAIRPNRTVVMFELPLPPLCARYGCVQRHLARKYGAKLIPKRLFAKLLSTSGATVDGIHLSNAGHSEMVQFIKRLFGQQLGVGTGVYQRMERSPTTGIP